MKTRITELLDVKYPIVLASMAWITDAVLAAAVSNAGGLGTIGPNSGSNTVTADAVETGERLRAEIRKCRTLTDKPFSVNFVVGVGGMDREYSDACVEVGIEEKVPVAIVSQGSPGAYTKRLKEAGMKVIHVCSNVRHVRKAEEAGVDAVIASGTEGGGHSGFDRIATMCLVPLVADAVQIPIIAGGGIVDGAGFMGAMGLGAEGIYMGTRFITTQECPAHPNAKQAILDATDVSTISISHGTPGAKAVENLGNRGFVEERRGSIRMLINDPVRRSRIAAGGFQSYDEVVTGKESPEQNVESNRTVDAFIHGKLDSNSITSGQGAGLINDIPTCKELIDRIMVDAENILKNLNQIFS